MLVVHATKKLLDRVGTPTVKPIELRGAPSAG